MFAMAQQWRLADHVRALVFDTTASYSGWKLVPVFNLKDLLKNTTKIINACMPKPLFERILCVVHKELFQDLKTPF